LSNETEKDDKDVAREGEKKREREIGRAREREREGTEKGLALACRRR